MIFPDLDTETLKEIHISLGCFFFAFTGSYLQELLNIYRGIQRSTRLHKIIIGTIIGTLLYMTIVYRYFRDLHITLLVIINVFCGSVGYEIFRKCSSIESMKEAARDVNDIFKNILGIDALLEYKKGKDNAKDESEEKDKK